MPTLEVTVAPLDLLAKKGAHEVFYFHSINTAVGSGVILTRKGKLVALGLIGERCPTVEKVIKDLTSRPQWKFASFLPSPSPQTYENYKEIELWGTPFQQKVWEALLELTTTTTYQEIATRIHHPKAYRAVGTAVGANPISLVVPCHLVLPSHQKSVGNYYWGSSFKKGLLKDLNGQ